MVKFFLTLSLSFFGLFSFGQSLVNENFESWIDNTAFIDPEGWISLNQLKPEYGLPFTLFKSTDAAEGQYAALMQTFTFKDGENKTDTIPSLLVYGSDVSSGVIYSWPKRLKTISFYYKYLPNGIDSGAMFLTVGYRDKKTNTMIKQGGAYYLFTRKQDSYAKASIPLYYSSNNKCDTFVLVFINSAEKINGNRCKPGTKLFIDDIDTEWEEFPAVAIQEISDPEFGIYPNPANDFIYVKGLSLGTYSAKILDNMGRTVLAETLTNESINIENLNPGFYHLHLSSADGGYSNSKYFIKK